MNADFLGVNSSDYSAEKADNTKSQKAMTKEDSWAKTFEPWRETQPSFVLTRITIETFTVAATGHIQHKAQETEETWAGVQHSIYNPAMALRTHSAKPTLSHLMYVGKKA